ncbi:DHH phosphoesterase [Bacillus phage G]|uniref:Gp260 n=1 Tax=Bacillus phage G TaxID=2884420 RepID=G3MA01_9CAUD|nr:DHH phosphoesterase [Bacillus phage G]AEO93519.1 gp260 [Bacillus phage G]
MSQIDKFVNKVLEKEINDIAIVMHNKPDGDSLGSSVALEESLLRLGKKVDLIIHNKIPKKYKSIVGKNRVNRKILPSFGKHYDLLIMVDFSDPTRTVNNVENLSNFIVVLDHHIANLPYGDLYICEDCSATGMLVYKIIEKIDKITPTIATAIYLSIIADTNNFRNQNTTSETLALSSKLLSFGANIEVVNSIMDDKSLAYMKLIGLTFKDIEYDANYKITYLVITRDKIKASGATGEEVSSLIDQIRWVKDSDITFLFIEGISNVRISARSNKTPVNDILKNFGGGGHRNAAGCAINGAFIHTVVYDVLKYSKGYIDNVKKK